MATLDTRVYSANFSGLTSTAVTCVAFLTVGLSLEGILKRLRRYPDEDAARKKGEGVPELESIGKRDRGMEDWAMGYLYRARTYVPHQPTPDDPRTPFKWIWDSIRLPQRFFEEHVGEDATIYVRFVRACHYWTLLMACTLFPILISVNYIYSAETYSAQSIERASTAALVNTPRESGKLWVHTVCLWFASISWYLALAWLGYGAVRARRNIIRKLVKRRLPPNEAKLWLSKTMSKKQTDRIVQEYDDEPYANVRDGKEQGWQQRTVMIRNIPENMRTEQGLLDYFTRHLRPDKEDVKTANFVKRQFNRHARHRVRGTAPATGEKGSTLISNIILVRKQAELNSLYIKYKQQLGLLETSQCQTVANAYEHVNKLREAETNPKKHHFWQRKDPVVSDEDRADDEVLKKAFEPFLGPSPRLDDPYAVWKMIDALEPRLLDRFQTLIKLKRFGQKVPATDYHLTKLNLLAALIKEKREHVEADELTGTAFVTFESVDDALFVRRYLTAKPGGIKYAGRAFECLVSPAPEFRDLDWNKLVKVSLTSDFVRGLVLQTLIWVVTLFWVIPLSFIVGLLSLNQIQNYLPGVAAWIKRNPVLLSIFSNLLPSAIVALISMFVPTVIGILTRNGQAFPTETKWQLATQARYWKWMMVNLVIVFSIGLSAFTAFLNAFKSPASVLTVIATSMPKAATFFCSWALLVIGIHHGIQVCLFGIPFINHASIRKMRSPRRREFEAQPRFFSYHYWVPNHLLVMAVTSLFAILNPVVIPFSMVYFCFATVVFKHQLAHVYWRRHFENGGRLVFRRTFRYSLDAFLVAQVVGMAFMWVQKLYRFGGAIIPLLPITVVIKLGGTRYFDRLMQEIDEAEARVLCGLSIPDNMSVEIVPPDDDMHRLPLRYHAQAFSDFIVKTVPALLFKLHVNLPRVRTASSQAWYARSGKQPSEKQHDSVNDSRAALRPSQSSSDSTSVASLEETLPNVSMMTERAQSGKVSDAAVARDTSIVRAHPPVLRDDRPVTNVPYDNPALVAPLAECLWLPRNPLKPLDLGDTVDYYGRILVSSQASESMLGTSSLAVDLALSDEKPDSAAEKDSDADAGPDVDTEERKDSLPRPEFRRDTSHQSGVSITVTPSTQTELSPAAADAVGAESSSSANAAGLAPIDVDKANDPSRRRTTSIGSQQNSPGSRIRRFSSRLSGQGSGVILSPGSAHGHGRGESIMSQSMAMQAEILEEHRQEVEKMKEQAEKERRESTNGSSWFHRTVLRTFEDESEA